MPSMGEARQGPTVSVALQLEALLGKPSAALSSCPIILNWIATSGLCPKAHAFYEPCALYALPAITDAGSSEVQAAPGAHTEKIEAEDLNDNRPDGTAGVISSEHGPAMQNLGLDAPRDVDPHVLADLRSSQPQTSRMDMRPLPTALVKILISALTNPRTASFAKAILDRLGLRYVNVALPQRIGHLALEGDCFLRETILETGRLPLAVMVEPTHGGFANTVLAEYFSRYITIIPRIPRGNLVERALADNGYAVYTAPYAVAMYETALSYDVFRRWGRRAPLFALTRGDRAETSEFLREVGVPAGAWFVCVHARASGYSPSDEHWHAHRNVDIADYAEAMDRIIKRGGWCVRMGDATMEPMPPRAGVVDYARGPHKSPRLDIALTGSCRFFLGCASGLYNVAAMFGRPSALANVTPLSGAYALGVEDLAIPQGIADEHGRLLPVAEIFASKVADFRLAEEFRNCALTPRNASPGDIAALSVEMMDRLDGVAAYTPDDDVRQDRFREFLRPGHYAYGTGSRIGRDYLRTHMPLG